MDDLKKAEQEFITWLDNVNYSGTITKRYKNCTYYRLIEGFKNGSNYNVSFDINSLGVAQVTQRANFPRAEQNYTIESFYQWMKEEGQRKRLIFQAP